MSKNKTRIGNNFHFKDQIPKDLTFGVVCKFQCGLCGEPYYGDCMKKLNVRIGEHMVSRHLPEYKLSLRTAPQPIIYYFANIYYLMTILMF